MTELRESKAKYSTSTEVERLKGLFQETRFRDLTNLVTPNGFRIDQDVLKTQTPEELSGYIAEFGPRNVSYVRDIFSLLEGSNYDPDDPQTVPLEDSIADLRRMHLLFEYYVQFPPGFSVNVQTSNSEQQMLTVEVPGDAIQTTKNIEAFTKASTYLANLLFMYANDGNPDWNEVADLITNTKKYSQNFRLDFRTRKSINHLSCIMGVMAMSRPTAEALEILDEQTAELEPVVEKVDMMLSDKTATSELSLDDLSKHHVKLLNNLGSFYTYKAELLLYSDTTLQRSFDEEFNRALLHLRNNAGRLQLRIDKHTENFNEELAKTLSNIAYLNLLQAEHQSGTNQFNPEIMSNALDNFLTFFLAAVTTINNHEFNDLDPEKFRRGGDFYRTLALIKVRKPGFLENYLNTKFEKTEFHPTKFSVMNLLTKRLTGCELPKRIDEGLLSSIARNLITISGGISKDAEYKVFQRRAEQNLAFCIREVNLGCSQPSH